jgi:hypothetical protein
MPLLPKNGIVASSGVRAVTRCEKRAASYRAVVVVASILIWLSM